MGRIASGAQDDNARGPHHERATFWLSIVRIVPAMPAIARAAHRTMRP